MTTATIDAAKETQRKRLARYWATVRASAVGEELEPGVVLDVLAEAGFDLERFEADADAVAKRIDLRGKLDAANVAQANVEALKGKLNYAAAVLQAAKVAYSTAAEPLLAQLGEQQAIVNRFGYAERALRESCNDPIILAEERAIAQQRQRLNGHLAELRESAADDERQIPKLAAELAECQEAAKRETMRQTMGPNEIADSLAAVVEQRRALHARRLAAIAQLEQEHAELEQRAAVLHAAKLQP